METDQVLIFENCRTCSNRCFSTGQVIKEINQLISERNLIKRVKSKLPSPILYHHMLRISLSGCPNSCSQPQIKDVGIQAQRIAAVNKELCEGCGECVKSCPDKAIAVDKTADIDKSKCLNCGLCIKSCPVNAIEEVDLGFRVLAGGKLGRRPHLAGTLYPLVGIDELVPIIAELLEVYLEQGEFGEKFGSVINRVGLENLRKREGERYAG